MKLRQGQTTTIPERRKPSRGTILRFYTREDGQRVALVQPAAVEVRLDELEQEDGQAVPELLPELQRRLL